MTPPIDYDTTVTVPPSGLPGAPAERTLHERLANDARVERVLIPASALRARMAGLARELRAACPAARVLHFVVVLKGALAFAKELGEALFALDGTGVRYSLLQASTYGLGIKGGEESARDVAIELAPTDVRGRDVVLVDDLLDQGFTLDRLRHYLLNEAGVASLRLCVLLAKRLDGPSPAVQRLRAALQPEHVGFSVPDRWVAGFGIDAGEDFRNLPFVITVREAHYRS